MDERLKKRMREERTEQGSVTFGVFGLTEWEALIPAGKAKLRVSFTGGSMSGMGIVPATFTTSDMTVKRMIENSPQYKSGRIVKVYC